MGDDDPGAAPGPRVEGAADVVLGHGVEAGQRVVEDQQPARVGERTGQAEALAFAAGERGVGERGGVAVREQREEPVGAGRAGRFAYGVGRGGPGAVGDRVLDGGAEEGGAGEGVRHLAAEPGRFHAVQRDAVEQHAAGVRVEQPPGDRGQLGLAGAGASDDGQGRAAGDGQVDAGQQGLAVLFDADVAEFEVSGRVGDRAQAAVGQRGEGEEGVEALRGGAAAGQGAERSGEGADADGEARVAGGGDEFADADRARAEPESGDREDQQHEQGQQEAAAADGPPVHGPGAATVFGEGGQGFQDAAVFAGAGAGGADGVGAVQGLGETVGDQRLGALVVGPGVGGAPGEGAEQEDQERGAQEEGGGGPDVDEEEPDERAEREQDARDGSGCGDGRGRGVGGAGGEPGGEVAGGQGEGPAGFGGQDPRGGAGAQVCGEPGAGGRAGHGGRRVEPGLGEGEGGAEQQPGPGHGPAGDEPVDGVAQGGGQGEGGERPAGGAEEQPGEGGRMLPGEPSGAGRRAGDRVRVRQRHGGPFGSAERPLRARGRPARRWCSPTGRPVRVTGCRGPR